MLQAVLSRPRAAALSPGLFAALLALLLALAFSSPPQLKGDIDEYLLMTVAVASHGSPDIQAGDIAIGRRLAPELTRHFDALQAGMQEGKQMPKFGFYRGRDGDTHAIHFFAYSALAAGPFKLLQAVGANPLRCYQLVNLAAVFVLGWSLYRFFGGAGRALAGLALFMLAGGALYWNWSSPEVLSAAMLLSAFVWFSLNAPLAGGLLAGVAALQNPSIVLALGALPLLLWLQHGRAQVFKPRVLAGLALGGALFACAPLFNLYQFGTPSIIAIQATAPRFITLNRLYSLFLDLNQGMLLAIPGVALALAAWGWRRAERAGQAALLALCTGAMLALVLPALSVVNWNSGATGVMRYAFWAAMPLLFALLHRLRHMPAWPAAPLAMLFLLQATAMALFTRYDYVSFSPLARHVMKHYPGAYHPDPEIFIERSNHEDGLNDVLRTYQWQTRAGVVTKTLYYGPAPQLPGEQLCGAGRALVGEKPPVAADGGWLYLDGPVHCTPARQYALEAPGLLHAGWGTQDERDGQRFGVWSVGQRSRLVLAPGAASAIRIRGDYMQGNLRTRVSINGQDLGWHNLRNDAFLPLPHAASYTIELAHEAPQRAGPTDDRQFAFYLQKIDLI